MKRYETLCGALIGLILFAMIAWIDSIYHTKPVHAQNAPDKGKCTITATTACIFNSTGIISAGMAVSICKAGETYLSEPDGAYECGIIGSSPRFVPAETPIACDASVFGTCGITAHWECDQGYRLDGFTIYWSDAGIAEIKPIRCIK